MDTKIFRCSSTLYKMSVHRFDIHRTEGQLFIVLCILRNIQSSLHCVIIVHCDYSDIEYFLYLYIQDTRIFLPPPHTPLSSLPSTSSSLSVTTDLFSDPVVLPCAENHVVSYV